MSPIDKCALEFVKHGVDFAYCLEQEYQRGFVFSTPDFFIMGFAVRRNVNGLLWDHSDNPDAWYITGMAGDMDKAWSILPYELPFVSFQRFDNSLRFIPIERLRRLSKHEPALVS